MAVRAENKPHYIFTTNKWYKVYKKTIRGQTRYFIVTPYFLQNGLVTIYKECEFRRNKQTDTPPMSGSEICLHDFIEKPYVYRNQVFYSLVIYKWEERHNISLMRDTRILDYMNEMEQEGIEDFNDNKGIYL